MLYYKVIDSSTLELLNWLQSLPEIRDMRLAGGTALALQIGHRKSIDLDFFGVLNGDSLSLSKRLNQKESVRLLSKTENISIYLVNDVKVDIVNYPYPWIEPLTKIDNISLAGLKDIAAMKLAAITGRGSRKDFYDIYFLLQKFTLKDILEFYNQKFYDGSEFMVLKSLSYFDDAQSEEDPFMLINVGWEDVKKSISMTLNSYLRE